jgi:hypothetical protein
VNGHRVAVRWRGTPVGVYTSEPSWQFPDMWYDEGRWWPEQTAAAAQFEALSATTDGKQPMASPRVWIELYEVAGGGEWRFANHAVVVSLRDGVLQIKRMWDGQPDADAEPRAAPDRRGE